MQVLIILVCTVAIALVAAYIYIRAIKGTSHAETLSIICRHIRTGFKSGYSLYTKSKNREYQFPYLVRAAEPFSHIIANELHLCKRCKLWETGHINSDVFSISFKLLNTTNSCEDSELRELLTAELQEIYARLFGQVYPLVYAVSFDRNIIVFWVAANLHGNNLIHQRANSDYYADMTELEVLEDD